MKMTIFKMFSLAVLMMSFQTQADTSTTQKDDIIEKLPNYNISKLPVDYQCGTAKFKNQKITKLVGQARVGLNEGTVSIPTENKMSWQITRSDHKVLVEMKDSQGRVLYSSQTLEMAPISAYVASIHEFLICNPFPSKYLLIPSENAAYGAKFQN